MNKQEQKKLLTEIMQADEKDGLYSDGNKMKSTQTAVEYLISNLPQRFKNGIINMYAEEIEQAKQIEKEQIVKSYEAGWVNGDLKKAPRFGEEYYNDTFLRM